MQIAGQRHLRATCRGRLLAFIGSVVALLLSFPAAADDSVTVRVGTWRFVLPSGYQLRTDTPNPAYRKELDGPFHTAVMEIAVLHEMRWTEETLFPDPAHPEVAIRQALQKSADEQMRAMRESAAEPEGRITQITVEEVDPSVLPRQNICAGNRWWVIDVGVQPHVGEPFVMHGIDILCFDYSVSNRSIGMIGLRLSERYCEALGHTPIDDFEAYAAAIFRTLRYRIEEQDTATSSTGEITDFDTIAGLLGAAILPPEAPKACP